VSEPPSRAWDFGTGTGHWMIWMLVRLDSPNFHTEMRFVCVLMMFDVVSWEANRTSAPYLHAEDSNLKGNL